VYVARERGSQKVLGRSSILLNRLPTKAVNGQTPFEAWHGFKPLLENLKIFGCLCFSHIPQPKRDKLDKKAEPGIFIGYSLQSKAFRIFQPQTGKILVSRDVDFVETKTMGLGWRKIRKRS